MGIHFTCAVPAESPTVRISLLPFPCAYLLERGHCSSESWARPDGCSERRRDPGSYAVVATPENQRARQKRQLALGRKEKIGVVSAASVVL